MWSTISFVAFPAQLSAPYRTHPAVREMLERSGSSPLTLNLDLAIPRNRGQESDGLDELAATLLPHRSRVVSLSIVADKSYSVPRFFGLVPDFPGLRVLSAVGPVSSGLQRDELWELPMLQAPALENAKLLGHHIQTTNEGRLGRNELSNLRSLHTTFRGAKDLFLSLAPCLALTTLHLDLQGRDEVPGSSLLRKALKDVTHLRVSNIHHGTQKEIPEAFRLKVL